MLNDRLVGPWELVSFTGVTRSGRTVFPMGEKVAGSLLYAGGQVSVNLMSAVRVRGAPGIRLDVLEDAAAGPLARGYMAYSGPYEVDEARGVVRHHFRLCLDPDLIGTLQERHVRFLDDDLVLAVRDPGALPVVLRWRRP
jgi:hypothetical protein